jgi:hypothetical protein
VEQLHDDFSSHVFGSASVTVTTTLPPLDEPSMATEEANVSVPRLPKHSKIPQSDSKKQADRLKANMAKKKGKGTRANANRAGPTKKGTGKTKRKGKNGK